MAGLQEGALSCATDSSQQQLQVGSGKCQCEWFWTKERENSHFWMIVLRPFMAFLTREESKSSWYTSWKKKPHQQYVFNFYETEDIYSTVSTKCNRYLLSAGEWQINVADRLSLKLPVLTNSSLLHIRLQNAAAALDWNHIWMSFDPAIAVILTGPFGQLGMRQSGN